MHRMELISSIPVLSSLLTTEREEIARRLDKHKYEEGAKILEPKDVAKFWYVLASGEIKVEQKGPAGTRSTTLTLPGQCFGSVCIFPPNPPIGRTYKCETPVEVYKLKGE